MKSENVPKEVKVMYTKTLSYSLFKFKKEVEVIRKVELTMKEKEKYSIIKRLVDTNGNKKRAALKLGCTVRTVNRLVVGYKEQGKEFFVHGNREKTPVNAIPQAVRRKALDLYQEKYLGANITQFQELLLERDNILISRTSLSKILREEHILSPKAHRSSRKELKELKTIAKTKKEFAVLQSAIVGLDEAHPRRPRSAYFGEMLQMDASEFVWFGDVKTHLHIAVDYATGTIVGAFFDTQETLKGYYNVLKQILTDYGIPAQFFTDNRSVFEYKKSGKN
jgi:hypothetical protein